ncbi:MULTISPECIES: hypothetical protein [unclassified Providencia]|uniref:hypothetical protein n=1 Tax=unclassified Providencia TaxID=2633465 RepID=UPI00234B3E38|nr:MULTISPECIES: hypothetical protein [unclassified Providencia]
MNNTILVENTVNELTYAESILNMIIDNDVKADGSLFNSIESVVKNISRAKKNVCGITTEDKKWLGSTPITESESLEGAVNTVLSTLNIAIDLKADEESGSLKNRYDSIIRLLLSARMSMEVIYQKVSTQ